MKEFVFAVTLYVPFTRFFSLEWKIIRNINLNCKTVTRMTSRHTEAAQTCIAIKKRLTVFISDANGIVGGELKEACVKCEINPFEI